MLSSAWQNIPNPIRLFSFTIIYLLQIRRGPYSCHPTAVPYGPACGCAAAARAPGCAAREASAIHSHVSLGWLRTWLRMNSRPPKQAQPQSHIHAHVYVHVHVHVHVHMPCAQMCVVHVSHRQHWFVVPLRTLSRTSAARARRRALPGPFELLPSAWASMQAGHR